MAKGILSFFGGLSILAGIITILAGFLTSEDIARGISIAWGSALLIAGAPLLGFARVITLLEQIARNTTPIALTSLPVSNTPSIEEMIAKHAREAVGR